MRNYLLTAVCGMVLGLTAADTKAECTSTPDCTSLGYTFTESDCPLESVKCPTNPSMVYCDSILKPVQPDKEDCTGVNEVLIPANARCTEMKLSCPSKCTGWSCNDGYVKSGFSCVKQATSTCSGNMKEVICDNITACCPFEYATCRYATVIPNNYGCYYTAQAPLDPPEAIKTCEDYGYYTSRKTPITQWTCRQIQVSNGNLSCYDCTKTTIDGKKNCIGGAPGSTCACGGTHSGYAGGHVCLSVTL